MLRHRLDSQWRAPEALRSGRKRTKRGGVFDAADGTRCGRDQCLGRAAAGWRRALAGLVRTAGTNRCKVGLISSGVLVFGEPGGYLCAATSDTCNANVSTYPSCPFLHQVNSEVRTGVYSLHQEPNPIVFDV